MITCKVAYKIGPQPSKCQISKKSLGLAFLLSACFVPMQTSAQESESNIVNERGLSEAAENLSKILRDAKDKGLVQEKRPDGSIDENNFAEKISVNCDIGEVLKFKSLQPIELYEDLTVAKSVSEEMKGVYGALHLARVQLSLGLGPEAKATLEPFDTIEAELLKRAAGLLTHPHFDIDEPVIDNYSDCNSHVKIWGMLENEEYFRNPIAGGERRKLINDVTEFPKFLRETISINLGIKAAENGEMNLARALWEKLDTDARENGTRLPDEKTDKHNYLYLDGLLNKDSDPDFYISVLNYLSEREGEFRLTALTQLSKENRSSKVKINTSLEDDLVEVSQNFSSGSESQLAALELVKNRIHVGRAIDAVVATRKYFNPSDAEFRQSVLQITELVQSRLKSDNNLKRITGLNDYLFDKEFYEEAGDTDSLKTNALSAAILAGLPGLHDQIIQSKENMPEAAKPLLEQAEFFSNLKTGNQEGISERVRNVSLSNQNAKQTAHQALGNNDVDLARSMAAKLAEGEDRKAIIQDIAWIEGRWADTAKNDDAIIDVLTKEVPPPIALTDRQWIKKLPTKLNDIETTLQKTQDYLKNG